jgi:PAS domain S-box-containing protein
MGELERRTGEDREVYPAKGREPEVAPGEREERVRGAFHASAIGFAIVEIDGRVRAVNRSFCDILGYSEFELPGITFSELTGADDVEPHRRLVSGEFDSYQLERRHVRRDGRIVWCMLAVSVVRDATGKPAYFVSQLVDVSARKDAERALTRHAADLERSNRELEEFAYVASHDLQQPLRTVASYVDLLATRYRGRLDERADRWIGFVVQGVERMQRLTNDLLKLARVRTDGDRLGPTDMHATVVRSWERLRNAGATHDAQLTTGDLPVIDADGAQMDQLIDNLLENACKYRRPEVRLLVDVSAVRRPASDVLRDDVSWEFAVKDNGIGFDMAHAARIFEIFQRLHHEHEYGGTGIGLAICRRIVERHSGRIWVNSALGQGSTFFFMLLEHRSR